MATNLALDDKTKKSAVNEALKEYIQRREQLQILNLFGTIDYDKNYKYKAGRSRK